MENEITQSTEQPSEPIETKRKKHNPSVDDRLLQAQIAFDNIAKDELLKSALVEYGYNDEKLKIGRGLLNDLQERYQKQKSDYGTQFKESGTFHQLWRDAHTTYTDYIKIARIAFRDKIEIRGVLMLDEKRKYNFSGWLTQARGFYNAALNDGKIQNEMQKFGISLEKLNSGFSKVERAIHAKEQHGLGKAEARTSTKERDVMLNEFDLYFKDFKTIAKIAFKNKQDWLKKLGM